MLSIFRSSCCCWSLLLLSYNAAYQFPLAPPFQFSFLRRCEQQPKIIKSVLLGPFERHPRKGLTTSPVLHSREKGKHHAVQVIEEAQQVEAQFDRALINILRNLVPVDKRPKRQRHYVRSSIMASGI